MNRLCKQKFLLLLICLNLSSFSLIAQITVSGIVVDLHTDKVIHNANILNLKSNTGTTSSINGRFIISSPANTLEIKISHLGYQTETILCSKDTILKIFLIPSNEILEEVQISANIKPETILEKARSSVIDFVLLEKDIMILEYLSSFRAPNILIIDPQGTSKYVQTIKGIKGIKGLRKSCNGAIYLETNTVAYPILPLGRDSLCLGKPISSRVYDERIIPCKFIANGLLYYIQKTQMDMVVGIKSYNPVTKEILLLHEIIDKELLASFQRDKYEMSRGQHISTMQTTDYGTNQRIRAMQEHSDYLIQVEYQQKHPNFIFPDKNKILVYDHLNKKIKYLGDSYEETDMQYELNSAFCNVILRDEKKQNFYLAHKIANEIQISQINPSTGKAKFVTAIQCRRALVDKIKVHDGILYYLASDEQATMKRSLNKIRLN